MNTQVFRFRVRVLCHQNHVNKTFKVQGGALEIFFVANILFKFRVLRSVTFGHQNHQIGVAFGDILPTFGHPFGASGPPGSDLATESNFERFPGESPTPLGYPFGT